MLDSLLRASFLTAALLVAGGCDRDGAPAPDVSGSASASGTTPGAGGTVTPASTAEPYEAPTRPPTKWALLVGINAYKSDQVSDLAGCVNDVEKMKALLTGKFEFPPDHVRVLTDEQATRAALIEAFEQHLIANAERDDIVVFHYSGHGSQMPDQDDDEPDGLDETIVPHDSRQGDVYDLSDDELNGLMARLGARTQNITLIFDSCHSGTATRDVGSRTRKTPPDDRTPPPPAAFAQSTRGTQEASLLQPGAGYVLLSAAREKQLAYEHLEGDAEYGAFTYYLTEELARAGAGATYRDVMDRVAGKIQRFYLRQEPQVEGTALDAYVFSDSSSLAQPYVLVSPSADGTVTVEAGRVHGMTEGSLFDVYAPGTKTFDDGAAPLARVRLGTPGPFTAEAEVVEGGGVPDGARAVERQHQFADQQLYVYYDGLSASPTLQAVKAQLDALGHVATAARRRQAHLVLRDEDGAVHLEGTDASIRSPAVPTGEGGAARRVADQVEAWARWFNVLAIENPAPVLDLAFSVEAERPGGGTRDPYAQPDRPGAVLADGETIVVTAENRSDRDLYLTILDLSSDGSIAVIFPEAQGASELLEAGGRLTRRFGTYVPEGRDAVKDILKVFATPNPVDFHALTQPGTRSADVPDDPLSRLLAQATTGQTRQTRPVTLTDWVTAQRAFVVERQP